MLHLIIIAACAASVSACIAFNETKRVPRPFTCKTFGDLAQVVGGGALIGSLLGFVVMPAFIPALLVGMAVSCLFIIPNRNNPGNPL